MTITLSHRVSQVKSSITLNLSTEANRLKASGQDIINLTVGEPDFDTPEFIKEAAKKALDQGFTKYTAVDGMPLLKEAVIEKLKKENQLDYKCDQIIISSGAKQSIYNLMQALLNPDDEVIIPTPYWASYPDMALLAGAKSVFITAGIEQTFKITSDQLEKAITPQTRLFIINSPSNPTGMVYTRQELCELAKVLLKHPKIFILTDDIYEHIYWGETAFENIVNVCPELYGRTLVLNGCSKAYAMTGWRIGYAAGPKKLIEAMTTIQSQSTSGPNSIAQMAAKTALTGPQDCVSRMNKIYKERHDFFSQGLNAIPDVTCLPARGAFYCFPSLHPFIGKDKKFKSDGELASHLLTEALIAVVPGSAFGSPGYLRFSFAVDKHRLKSALSRLATTLSRLQENS